MSHKHRYETTEIVLSKRFVRACGDVVAEQVEDFHRPEEQDHIWVTVDCGMGQHLVAVVNVYSLKCHLAGLDERPRVGMLYGECDALPSLGIEEDVAFDYEDYDEDVFYEHYNRTDCEHLLIALAREAQRMEIWGEYFHRGRHGFHQIHSRRASAVDPYDLRGHDGALKFYRRSIDGYAWTMVFMKFFGQP